jgi:hypothetical protein
MVEAIAAQGRNGDDELLHISKGELRDLKKIGDAIGIKTTINPKTGIAEAFNWVKPLATIAGGTVGFVASGFNPLGAAAGASLAAGATTAAQGGSTNDVLMNAAISGATAYAGAGIASGLSEAGSAAAQTGTEVVGQGAVQGGTSAIGQGAVQGGTSAVGQGATQTMTAPVAESGIQGLAMNPNLVTEAAPEVATTVAPQAVDSGIQGLRMAPELAPAPTAAPAPASFTDNMIAGFKNTPGTELIDKYGTKAVGAGMGLGTLAAMPNSYGDTTETDESGKPRYKGETYYDKYGYMRSRAVPMAAGGLASMAKGRYLQGPGDGMSDSIPARIDGKQEARLATNEFVVPADVVSHIGNGSSEAGAKELHKMMDRIRVARTGTKKQGKQINPRKLLPA